jgi:hypothetical protein
MPMANIKIDFDIYDPRYLTDPESSTCFEAGCETMNEAKRAAKEYGENNVIVRTLSVWNGSAWVVESSSIEN